MKTNVILKLTIQRLIIVALKINFANITEIFLTEHAKNAIFPVSNVKEAIQKTVFNASQETYSIKENVSMNVKKIYIF